MINVLDRVPTRAGRIKITHDDGTSEYVTIERADEPVEIGTPINKALFDSIQADIDGITVGRYFEPVHSYIYADNEKTYERSHIPIMASNSQNGFVATGTTSSTSYYNLFAENKTITIRENQYVDIELDKAIIPKEIKFQNTYARHYKILASQDGITYDTLVEDIEAPYDYVDAVVNLSSVNKLYKYIRLQNLGNLNNSSSARNFRITKAIVNEIVRNDLSLDIPLKELPNQRIMIHTPIEQDTLYPTQITFENMVCQLNGNVSPNQKYELVYINGLLQIEKELDSSPVIPNLSIKTGTISHGATIPQTAGYTNYIYFVSPYSAGADSAETNSYTADGNGWAITCQVNQTTRVVTSQATSKTRRDSSSTYTGITTKSATANYLEIAWK